MNTNGRILEIINIIKGQIDEVADIIKDFSSDAVDLSEVKSLIESLVEDVGKEEYYKGETDGYQDGYEEGETNGYKEGKTDAESNR